jgi:hypothetical protein
MDREKSSPDEMKRSLVNRYRETLINKLTRQDLFELQSSLREQYDPVRGWDQKNRLKFETKLRQYFHEEIIRREISGIEAVLALLTPEDLQS